MHVLLGFLLLILGVTCLSQQIENKLPASKTWIQLLNKYQALLGLICAGFIVIELLRLVIVLVQLGVPPIHILLSLVTFLLVFLFGIMFGFEIIGEPLRRVYPPLSLSLGNLRFRLLPYRSVLGISAFIVGVLDILI